MHSIFLLFFIASQLLSAQDLDKVTLQLKWTHAFQFAGYYAAKEKGYYKDVGLDVTILPATPGMDPVESVVDKKADYGVGSSSLLLSRAAGAKVVVLAVIFQESPYEIHTNIAIHSLHDLIGKRIMLEAQSGELLAYLHHEGISSDQLTLLPHSFNPQDLIDHNVDAMSGYISNEPYYYKLAKFSYRSFTPRSAGIDFYGDNLFTSEEELHENPQRVEKFREASLRGWQYAKEHKEEIINLIINKYAPTLTFDQLQYESDQMIPLLQPDLIEIGYMNPKRWQHIANVYKELKLLPQEFTLDSFIYDSSNPLLPKWVTNTFISIAIFVIMILLMLSYVLRTNKILRNNKNLFKTLYKRSPLGLAMIDFDTGAFISANSSMINSTGYTVEELKHFTCWDLTPTNFHEQLKEQFSLLNTNTSFGPYEKECFKKDGSTYPVETMGFIMKDPSDKPIMWTFIKDLSEEKKIEEDLKLTNAKFQHLIENIAGDYCFYIHDTNGIVTYISHSIIDMLGYTSEEAKVHYSNFLSNHSINHQIIAKTKAALQGIKQANYLAEFIHKDNSKRWIEITESPIFDSKGMVIGVEGVMHNVTLLKESENKLKLAASVFTYAKEGIYISDPDGNIIDANDAYCILTGYSRAELIGKNSRLLQSEKQSKEFYETMWKSLLTDGFWSDEIWNRRKNGEIYAQILTISAVYDENKTLINFVALMTDITTIKNHQSELENIAHYDHLTKLPNRLSILERLSNAIIISSQQNAILVVLFLDLDGFKAVNDTYGHDIGDELLKILAHRMEATLRKNDTLARIGGDEFVGLLRDLKQIDEALPVIQRLLQSASAPVNIANVSLNISVSIGVAVYPNNGFDADMLLRNADRAMYEAKQKGKNQYVIFNG
ncbi:MAG: diguanylate cyclase [Sulfurimonas sp.]|nr:diguanylate cyclase [Sulfurimonas sp.]